MSRARLSAIQIGEIIERCKSGGPGIVVALSVEYGVNRATIINHAKRNGLTIVKKRRRRNGWSDDDGSPVSDFVPYEELLRRQEEESRRRKETCVCAHTMLKCSSCGRCHDNVMTDMAYKIRTLETEIARLKRGGR